MTRLLLLLATLVGLGIAVALIGSVGAAPVLAAVRGIGGYGFAIFCGYTLIVLTVLGLAWYAVAPGVPASRAWCFIWGRTTREAATDVLPFAQIGGLVVGGRTVAAHGIAETLVFASMIADLTTEMASQLVFTLAGVAVLAAIVADAPAGAQLLWMACGGLGAILATLLALTIGQRLGLDIGGKLAARLLPGAIAASQRISETLSAIYCSPARLGAAFLLNLLAWIASAAGAWIALRFMGVTIPLWAVLTIESLIFALRSAAFMVPGAIGLQEGAYLLIGPLFGLGPEVALALSLLKRARDLAIGIPALIAWQVIESSRIIGARGARAGT